MRTVFADTFYFLALLSPSDQTHAKAVAFTSANTVRMVTTKWVLTEFADGLARSPRGRIEFLATLADLQMDADATIAPCVHSLMTEGVRLYGQRPDKKWSLTDCISFVVMTSAGIAEAPTGDHHFEQAGFVALLK
ncbi:MAG TPA: PIN domain-containing protein [Tepidisphaeraceae bacterium]|jgi:predicted nucleic acid-binding protein|nr:PIN domain-containing protein [Tepidisphaeraceae bacterium]